MRAAAAIVLRDLRLAYRRGFESLLGLIFFLIALSLFPLGVGASPDILARIGPGVIWVLALLATLLAIDRLWQQDFEDGSLELMVLASAPLEVLVVAKCFAHWLTSGLLLVIASPALALLMALPPASFWAVPLALLLGTPSLALIGGIGAALVVGSRRGNVLMALLVLPLFIPVLIFGVSAVEGVLLARPSRTPFLVLLAILLGSLALAPFASAQAIRLALE